MDQRRARGLKPHATVRELIPETIRQSIGCVCCDPKLERMRSFFKRVELNVVSISLIKLCEKLPAAKALWFDQAPTTHISGVCNVLVSAGQSRDTRYYVPLVHSMSWWSDGDRLERWPR